MKFYDFSANKIDGKPIGLSEFKGQVVLVVNVASRCGLTAQYAGLEKLYRTYKDQGFVILGFPCNQFAGQEPGLEAEIQKFCVVNYGVTFPLFEKIKVNGKEAHPLYQYLKAEQKGLLGSAAIKWNFTKFLVDRQGHVLKRFAPKTPPAEFESDIKALL